MQRIQHFIAAYSAIDVWFGPVRPGPGIIHPRSNLAVQTFLKGQTAVSVLLQLDNQAAVTTWEDSIPAVDTACEGALDVCLIQEHYSCCGTHPGDHQLRGRH